MLRQVQISGMEKRQKERDALFRSCSMLGQSGSAVEVRGPTVGEAEDTSTVFYAL